MFGILWISLLLAQRKWGFLFKIVPLEIVSEEKKMGKKRFDKILFHIFHTFT